LPWGLSTFKTCQISKGDGKKGEGAGAEAGEGSTDQNNAETQGARLLQGLIQQQLTISCQVGKS